MQRAKQPRNRRTRRRVQNQVANEVRQEVKKEIRREVKKPKKSFVRQALEGGAYLVGNTIGQGKLARSIASTGLDYIGVGAYKFADGTVQGTPPPTRIKKIEFVKNITSTISFSDWSRNINPADAVLFPWLSQIATSFQRFRFNSLVFHFKTTCGSAISSTNNALGVFGLVANYDPSAPPFSTKVEAESTGKCRSTVPSKSVFYGIECKKSQRTYPWYFTYITGVDEKEDKLLYPARINYFTDGMQAAGITIGELWVEYDITFIDTVKENPGGSPQSDIYSLSSTTSSTTIGPVTLLSGNLKTSLTSGGILTFPKGLAPGNYFVYFFMQLSAAGTVGVTIGTFSSNIVSGSLGYNIQGLVPAPTAGVSDGLKSYSAIFEKLDSEEASITLAVSGSKSSTGGWVLVVPAYAPLDGVKLSYRDKIVREVLQQLGRTGHVAIPSCTSYTEEDSLDS